MQVIQVFMHNSLRNFNYVIYSEKTKKAIFVDPYDIERTMPYAKELGLDPVGLINTHQHGDHVKDNERFLEMTKAVKIELKNGERYFLSDDESLQALDTPGHTMQHQCFFLEKGRKAWGILSGDTLFNAGVGNCKNGGNVETLYRTVKEVFAGLSDELILYPGHDYMLNNLDFCLSVDPDNQLAKEMRERRKAQDLDQEFIWTNLKQERQLNPFLRLDKLGGKFKDMSEKEIFFELRKLRDSW